MATLAVNVDHIATVRQARLATEPDPVTAAALAELAGCQGIIVHLREDRRHIQVRDVEVLRKTVTTKLNLEMAAIPEIVRIAQTIKPDMATLVPEKRRELTTEGGLNVAGQKKSIRATVRELHKKGIVVSLFIDPDAEQISAAKECGAEFIELHTGIYSNARTEKKQDREFDRICGAVETAAALGLKVNAGHGLDYRNISRLVAIRGIEEFSIGHSIIARAVLVGMERAVREMLELIQQGSHRGGR
ncbi:MAG: pyridoxine 5'-phosphate synthase [Proteobacteria bacterium]|nr:pyridoxine 5'-phosphate synthase [Pseudomonadota bacterium]